MTQDWYTEIFYPLQDALLALIRDADHGLYLSGGTAASRGYLHHRYSDDLDFFANDADEFPLWVARCREQLMREAAFHVRVVLMEERFVRLFIHHGDTQIKLEFVNDVPSRIGTPIMHPALGRLDTPENILANKVCAVLDRREPKDLADIWGFVERMRLSLDAAITGASGKAAGIFPPLVAKVLLSSDVTDWESVRWIDPPDRAAFVGALHAIGEALLLGGSSAVGYRGM